MRGTRSQMTWGRRFFLAVSILLGAFSFIASAEHAHAQQVCKSYPGPTGAAETSVCYKYQAALDVRAILETYYARTEKWKDTLSKYAMNLFWTLVSIELTWTAITMAVKGRELDAWLREILGRVFYVGFFYFVLSQSSTLLPAIANSFTGAGNAVAKTANVQLVGTPSPATMGSADPVYIFNAGMDIAFLLWKQASNHAEVHAFFIASCAIIVAILFSIVAAIVIVALVEAYIYMSAAILFLGFGGSTWTGVYAQNMLRLAVGIGAKLFIIQLLVVLGYTVIEKHVLNLNTLAVTCYSGEAWYVPDGGAGAKSNDKTSEAKAKQDCDKRKADTSDKGQIGLLLSLIAAITVFALLIYSIPDLVQSLLTGKSRAEGSAGEAAAVNWITSPATMVSLVGGGGFSVPGLASAGLSLASKGNLAAGMTGSFKDFADSVGKSRDTFLSMVGGRLGGAQGKLPVAPQTGEARPPVIAPEAGKKE